MLNLTFAVLFVALYHIGCGQVPVEQCRDIMVVVELKSDDKASAIHAKDFVHNLKGVIKPDGRCKKLGFIFVWKMVESVVTLDCNSEKCFIEGRKTADKIIQEVFLFRGAYDRWGLVKGMKMAAKQLRPAGLNPKDQRNKLLVLILSNPSSPEGPIITDEVKDILDLGIKVMAIGLGAGNSKMLNDIATSNRFAIQMTNFKELSTTGAATIGRVLAPVEFLQESRIPGSLLGEPIEDLRIATLKADANNVCTNIVDIAFLVDSSGSVRKYYMDEKFFVQRIAARFKIIEQGTHGGVIVFSSHGYVKMAIKFTDFLTTKSFNEAVGLLPFYGYMTRIDHALSLAHKELFTEKGKTRPNVKKLLFLITDGRQNPDNIGGVKLDPAKEAEKLHLGNVQIYAVGVGNKVNLTELQRITKDPRKVYSVADFAELTSTAFVNNVSKELCQGAVLATEEPLTGKPKTNCSKASSKCDECGCCGKKPVYVNIFQGSNNYVTQGQEVTQTGSGSSAGAIGGKLHAAEAVKKLSNEEIASYIKSLLPYYESMDKSVKELLARAIKKKSSQNVLNKK